MQFGILGPLEVRDGDTVVDIRRGVPRALLAALVLRAPEAVTAGTLAELIWADDQPRNPANALQVQVSYLRRQLGGAGRRQPIVTRGGGYALDVADDEIDARRFERAAADAAARSTEGYDGLVRALELYDEALALWRGEALADLVGEPFAIGAAARLEEMRLAAVESRHDVMLDLGRHRELVGELTRAITDHPLRERFHAQLLIALYRSGRQVDALRAYEHARVLLVEELGVEPGAELRDLERRVLQHDPSLDWVPPPGAPSAHTTPASPALGGPTAQATVPAPITELVGRDVEVARVLQLLDRSRVVTLTGPGGAGKTRLAIEVAGHVTTTGEPAPDPEVWFVDLGALDDDRLVASTVASALGIPVAHDPDGAADPATATAAIGAWLRGREGLLLLDTCERVVAGVAAMVVELVTGAPALRVLATSRRPLGITGEIAWPVPPLAVAAPDVASVEEAMSSPAIRLFVDRAVAVRPDFELTDDNVRDVAAICLSLDGLPLAIELAAAQADVLGPAAIRTRLDRRFELLADTGRTASPRQRNLRATIEWSLELLDEQHREFLGELATLPTTFDVDDASALLGADEAERALALLTGLVRHSLVTVAGDGRFRLLDTLRAYVRERSAEPRPR